jgi:hypothetical protein
MSNPYKIIYELRETIAELSERCREQEADIEELLKEREWISVKDRMPDEDEAILAWNKEGFPMIDVWSGKMWGYAWTVDEISHWMPIPEKPESEVDAE